MYTTVIGSTFLKEYNRRHATQYTPREFFDEVYFRLFFDDKKYLMWAQNSPFVQGISKKKPFFELAERAERLAQFHEKIGIGERDASIAIGYPAAEGKEFATTSGLVTDMAIAVSDADAYLSWIGGSLGAGIAGGYAILFDHPEILYAVFEGWQVYRRLLNEAVLDKLLPNKVTTWNGQWLTYRFGKDYRAEVDFLLLEEAGFFSKDEVEIGVETIEWSRLFFSLSRQYPESVQMGYIYALGQMNKTIGFVPFYLKNGTRLRDVYKQLWGEENYLKDRETFEALFGKHIKRACELGAIGLQALEPKNLAKYFSDENLDLARPEIALKKNEPAEEFVVRKRKLEEKDYENVITFKTYKTWLIAMLTKNKEEVKDYTAGIAAALVQYRADARKTDRKNLLENKLFASKRKLEFMETLIEIIQDKEVDSAIVEKVRELHEYVHYLSGEDFVYFWLLLKFEYVYQERNA